MNCELTPWFPGYVKPVRDGVYERDFSSRGWPNPIRKRVFENGSWRGYTCINDVWKKDDSTEIPWRGLSSDPTKG